MTPVVIDLDDRDQVDRLVEAIRKAGQGHAELQDEPWTRASMQLRQALREFANPTPPKPHEPTGLGAVVEDAEGFLWVRWSIDHRADRNWRRTGNEGGLYETWADVNTVCVLSEGVQP